MTMMTLAVMVASVAFTGGLVDWMARRRSPQRLFFVALGRDRTDADERRRRRLRIANAVLTLGGVAAVLSGQPTWMAVGATVAPLASTLWLTAEVMLTVRSATPETIPGRYAISLEDAPGVLDLVSAPLQVGNVLAVLLPLALFAWLSSHVTGTFPVHWDGTGAVDGTASAYGTAALGGVLVFDLLLLWFVLYGIQQERWAMPEVGAEAYRALALRRRRLLVRMIEWILLATNAGVGLVWMGVLAGGATGSESIGLVVSALASVFILAGVAVPMLRILPALRSVQDELRALAGTEVLGTRPDGWRLGGVVYFAPEDPALFVPKRVGIGQTFNLARPAAWAVLAAIVVIPLLLSWLLAR